MDRLIDLLRANARESVENMARMLDQPVEAVTAAIEEYERNGVIRGYQAMVNDDLLGVEQVRAVIELRIRPEREGGFDRLARRIGRFPQVVSMFLMSGGYDLLLFVKGRNLQEVAGFVSAKLANIDGVISTSTHFMLKTYKDQGVLMENDGHDERLQVSP